MDRIEAVTVCVGYGDFLAETLPHNLNRVDRLLVVTSEDDEETREICRRHDVETLLSADHTRPGGGVGGGTFNKGRLVERGLQHCSEGCWRLHLDGDTILPAQFRRLIEGAHLDTRKLYGADRRMVKSWEAWQRAQALGALSHMYSSIYMGGEFPLGDRWALAETGYVPIGFFQLWHSDADEWHGTRVKKYPIGHGGAHRTDVQFALKWDRRDREHLPEIVCIHLESEEGALGANWNGRRTRRFGPCPVPADHKPCS